MRALGMSERIIILVKLEKYTMKIWDRMNWFTINFSKFEIS
jgi:hypothetical protein